MNWDLQVVGRIQSEGRGTARAIGNNATAHGRALNRRVEVEFWYDDPLQDLPDEPQLCPEDFGAEICHARLRCTVG